MPQNQNPVIVVPGITGTSLYDEYPLKAEAVWTAVLNKEYQRLSLHPDDTRYEAMEPSLVRPGRLLDTAYDDIVVALRYDLTARADQPTPVFAFPYDWRQDVKESGSQLANFVEEVIARTALLRHYNGYRENPKVDLVAHSMGGMVICEYLEAAGGNRVEKIATLGTPFLGSLEALVKLLTGLGNLAGEIPKEREREAARSMPAIYQLLPSFKGAIVAASGDGAPETDLFEIGAWQPGVIESLEEYIRMHAVDPGNKSTRTARAKELLGSYLKRASEHRARITKLDLAAKGVAVSNWLAVVGVGAKTRVRASVALQRGEPRFQITEIDWVEGWAVNDASLDTGDATVPIAGALPPFLDKKHLVAVAPADFGTWEWRDQALASRVGFHAMLPNLNLAQRLVLRHLRGKDYKGEVWGRRAPGVAKADWDAPIPGLAAKEHGE
jgi:pimeloyl-ACP methyl ester carboxylesterase